MNRIPASLRLVFFATTVASLGGCAPKPAESAGFGLFENGVNHVATFHGFMDNFEACQLAARAFNAESSKDPEAWKAIGKEPDQWVCGKL